MPMPMPMPMPRFPNGRCSTKGAAQWGEFKVNNTASCLHILFWPFFVVFHHFVVFHVFLSFSFLFDEVSNFRNKIMHIQKLELVIRNRCQWNCMLPKKDKRSLKSEITLATWFQVLEIQATV